jgi:DNA-binding MarR family transcriptional regulator
VKAQLDGTRAELVEQFLALRPRMERGFGGEFERELREELQQVTLHQLSTLQQLREAPLPMSELARRLAVGESAATATADRLVRQGLVERQADPNDRRVVLLALSASGRSLVDAVHRAATSKMRRMLDVLSDSQLRQLVAIYETLCDAFQTTESEPGR